MPKISILWVTIATFTCSAASAQNVLVNGGFEGPPQPPGFGNNIGFTIAPWVTGNLPNVVKVDGPGCLNYGINGPESDATAPGSCVPQHYLDIAGGGLATIAQSFVAPCSGVIVFGGSFSTRANRAGFGTVTLRQGTTVVGTATVGLPAGTSRTDPWKLASATVSVSELSTYSFVVSMDDNTNFDNGFVNYSVPCACKSNIAYVPSATLLLPYFEVDLFAAGINTVFSINNAAASPVLAHVTIWSDQAVPVFAFDVDLPGLGGQTVDLHKIFLDGILPGTAPPLPSCAQLPRIVPAAGRAHLQRWLMGQSSNIPGLTNQCAGSRQLDGILRGYITVDTVTACNLFFPSDWVLYAPFITNQNVLWGNYSYVGQNLCFTANLVHIEACPTCFKPGDHTFYGRYNGASAADAREPLPTTLAASFPNAGRDTSFLVWRETDASDSAYNCDRQGPQSWYPLATKQIGVFGNLGVYCPIEKKIPNAANRIKVLTSFTGTIQFNLQHSEVAPPYGDSAAQAWVTVLDGSGSCTSGFHAVQLDCANAPNPTVFPNTCM